MKKRTKSGPLAKGRGVSLPADVWAQVDQRVSKLKPRVKGLSHYVQLLIDWDLHGNGDQKPFNNPDHQLGGMHFSA